MAAASTPDTSGYLGTTYLVPSDPNYYLSQTGLSALTPQAFNADTLSAMFSPQGMQYTPANNMATNPFLSLFMQSSADAMKLPRKQVPGMPGGQPGGPGQQAQMGGDGQQGPMI